MTGDFASTVTSIIGDFQGDIIAFLDAELRGSGANPSGKIRLTAVREI